MLGWLTLIVAVLAGLFVVFQNPSGDVSNQSAGLAAAGVVVVLLGLYAATHRMRWSERQSKSTIALLAAAVALAAGTWWLGPDRIAQLWPHVKSSTPESRATRELVTGAGPVSVLIRRDASGKFIAQGQLNGISAALLIDTGATAVMLRPSDADKAGIDVASLAFTTPVQTANGTLYAAPIRLRTISIGLLKVDDVEALVAKPGSLNENLLGMSFLRRLASYELNGDFMTLRE